MIGIFDSGLGGLSVWREVQRVLPQASTLYVADQAHAPYGERSAEEVRKFSESLVSHLRSQGCELIIVACHTASAVALDHLRQTFPDLLFIGMEPAIKPAAAASRNKIIGVLATERTLEGRLFKETAKKHAAGARIIQQPCPGLVQQVEAGNLEGVDVEALLRLLLIRCQEAGADTIVLACTHYPFVRPVMERILGPKVTILDPAPAIGQQAARLFRGPAKSRSGHRFETTGHAGTFARMAETLVQRPCETRQLRWESEELVYEDS